MDNTVTRELRRIANDLDAAFTRVADAELEQRLQDVKRQFIESVRKTQGLGHVDPEKLWNKMKDEIRMDIKQRPMDWRA